MPEMSMDDAAVALHELFSSYVKAGFSEDRAMQMLIAQIVANLQEGFRNRESE